MSGTADIGLVGLAVMGENLVLNMESRGYTVAVFNRTVAKVDAFVSGRGKDKKFVGAKSLKELVDACKKPRKIMLMVKAGAVVDSFIDQLVPLMEKGDVIIDGGNSHYPDTQRRSDALAEKGLLFVGTGVSGGEEGALLGPSMMPGGAPEAWPLVKDIFQAISAKVEDGSACCEWVGKGGSGHFVKMVHNGIEYGDMQLICEAYQLLKSLLGLSNDELSAVFSEWNKGDLDSYLIEITRDILAKKADDDPSAYVVDQVLDTAGQKGTGKWTAQVALELGMPVTLIGEAVFARCLSALKEERVKAAGLFDKAPVAQYSGDRQELIDAVRDAVFASKIVSYAQGYVLMRAASAEHNWDLNYGSIALMWRGGCIIRSTFLKDIKAAFDKDPGLSNLLLDKFFHDKIQKALAGWRKVASLALQVGVPVPAITTALCYFDGLTTARLPANLLQSQRDYFGAHQYERLDKPRGEFFHTNWTGKGGSTASRIANSPAPRSPFGLPPPSNENPQHLLQLLHQEESVRPTNHAPTGHPFGTVVPGVPMSPTMGRKRRFVAMDENENGPTDLFGPPPKHVRCDCAPVHELGLDQHQEGNKRKVEELSCLFPSLDLAASEAKRTRLVSSDGVKRPASSLSAVVSFDGVVLLKARVLCKEPFAVMVKLLESSAEMNVEKGQRYWCSTNPAQALGADGELLLRATHPA